MRRSFLDPATDRVGASAGPVPVGSNDPRTRGSTMLWHPAWPPAIGPMLNAAFDEGQHLAADRYRAALVGLRARPDDAISLSLKVPFCTARCLCCDREIGAAQPSTVIDDYLSALLREIAGVAEIVGRGRDVLQLQLGGGTANELSESQLVRLVDALQRHWRLPADAEMLADCDPRRASWTQLSVLGGLGFRRLTFGVFELDPVVQQAIGRGQSLALLADVCDMARSCGIESINLELMMGLPHQTDARWRGTLKSVIGTGPDRVTLTRYRHRPYLVPAQRGIDAHALPSPAQVVTLAATASTLLCDAGYRWIGADQFVLDTDELATAHDAGQLRRSLISYTGMPSTPMLGLGVGAVGEIDGEVFWNEASLPAWHGALHDGRLPVAHARPASIAESRRRAAVEHMLCRLELPWAMVEGGLEDAYRRLARHESQGLVRVLEGRISITEAGRHSLAALCGELHAASSAHDGSPMQWVS